MYSLLPLIGVLLLSIATFNAGAEEDRTATTPTTKTMPNNVELPWLLDKFAYFEIGDDLARKYLEEKHPGKTKVLEKALNATVRVEARYPSDSGDETTENGSGMIIKDGLVLTAGHGIHPLRDRKDLRIDISLRDGRVFNATIVASKYSGDEDWAILKIIEDEKLGPISTVFKKLSEPKKGETAFILGYPARMGLNSSTGKVEHNFGNDNKKLSALTTIAKIDDPNRISTVPVAGFTIEGGVSGGPVVNLNGELIGVQVTVSTNWHSTGLADYVVRATTLEKILHSKCKTCGHTAINRLMKNAE
jgi:S1-C subfamily serine protease